MGGGTTKTETDIAEMSDEERDLYALGRAWVDAAAQEQGYVMKQVETKVYEDPELVDAWRDNLEAVESDLAILEADDRSQDPNSPQYTRAYELRNKREELLSNISDAEESATTKIEYKMLQNAPDNVQSIMATLSGAEQTKLNNIINEYGYGSTEWYNAAKNIKVSSDVASVYGLETTEGALSESGQQKVDSINAQIQTLKDSLGTKTGTNAVASSMDKVKTTLKIAKLEKEKSRIYESEGLSKGGEYSLSDISGQIAMNQMEAGASEEDLKSKIITRINDLLDGKLIDVPEETRSSIESYINESYEPAIAAIEQSYERMGMDAEEAKLKAQNFIKEHGIEKLSQIDAEREAYRESFKRLSADERQSMLELAAGSGRSPLDEQFQRELTDRLGSYVAEQESRYSALERGAKELTQQQLAGVEKETALTTQNLLKEKELNKASLAADKSAQKAGQIYALQTGMPMQGISTGQAQYQLNAARSSQQLANALSQAGAYSGLAEPYRAERFGEATVTQTTSPSIFGTIVGGLAGGAMGAGSLMSGIGALKG